MINRFISNIKIELAKELPGISSQIKMSPSVRKSGAFTSKESKKRKAGVLILLYKKSDKINTVFTLRHDYEGPHGGQVSLPGGKYESVDLNITETALRESKEEIGIDIESITVLGRLTDLNIPVSNVIVTPVIGFTDLTPKFNPDPDEVKELIEVSLNDLFHSKNRKTEILRINSAKIEAPYFKVSDHHIWGATAMILSEFHDLLSRVINFE